MIKDSKKVEFAILAWRTYEEPLAAKLFRETKTSNTIGQINTWLKTTKDDDVMLKVLGKAGVELASRLAWGFIFGTVFAWYLLARGVILIVQGAESQVMKNPKIVVLN